MCLVSVWMTTYNHENFIAAAIESILMQQTNFDYEIIIGEDCSQDRTREIVLNYQKQYPQKIKLYLSEQNIGCNPMFHATYPLCKGKYVAWLDGDDYWTDPYKLQKQVDLLEANKDIIFCFHKVLVENKFNGSTKESFDFHRNPDNTWGMEHFLDERNPINTPSFFYKNILGNKLPDWFYSLPLPDLGFYFLLLEQGKGIYLEDMMAVYRVHEGGAWSGTSRYQKNHKLAIFDETIEPYLPEEYKSKINTQICFHYSILFELDFLSGNYKEALKYFQILKKYKFKGLGERKLWFIKFTIKVMFKPLLQYLKKTHQYTS